MRGITKLISRLIIGFSILLFLFYKIGIKDIANTFSEVNLWFIIPAVGVYLLTITIGLINLYILIVPINRKMRFPALGKIYMTSTFLGLITPGKLGELSLIYYLRKQKISTGEGLAITFLDKLISLIVLFAFASLGFFIFFEIHNALLMLLFSALFLMVIGIVLSAKGRFLIRKYILRKYSIYFRGFSRTVFMYLKENKKYLIANLMITTVRNVVNAAVVYLFFISLESYVSLVSLVIIFSISTIISYIPISISGLGLKEATAVALFSSMGVPSATTATAFILTLVITYGVSGALVLVYLDVFKELLDIKNSIKKRI